MSKYTRRALLSVSDKTGLEKIASALADCGVELVSTGGTAKAIEGFGLAVTYIEEVTHFPEIMGGRLKTLHPLVHGALLKIRGNSAHEEAAKTYGIGEFDFVIVNLYPFDKAIAKQSVTYHEAVENIDIGGPVMLRSGAKNHDAVTVVCDPDDYLKVTEEMRVYNGHTSLTLRRKLATKVFFHTGNYDRMIGAWLEGQKIS
ncbi:MAG: hypothetical protein Q7R65_02765 [bacterium]|nr:hypothetical protein [bacterium]